MTATWNPSDKGASITLSNGNLTFSGSGSGDDGVRAIIAHKTGKWLLKFSSVTLTAGDAGLGIALGSPALNSFGAAAASAAIIFSSGNVWINGTHSGLPALGNPNGNVQLIAVDLDNKKIWFKNGNGSWNGSGADPAANTGGLDISGFVTGSVNIFPIGLVGTLATNTAIADFADGPDDPSGFVPWNWNEQLSSEAASSERASSDHLASAAHEQDSSSNALAAHHSDERASSDHLLAEQISSDHFLNAGWNSADKESTVTLSNGNKTAVIGGSAIVAGVRGDISHATGKYYMEITWDAITNFTLEDTIQRYVGFYAGGAALSNPTDISKLAGVRVTAITVGLTTGLFIDFDSNQWGFKATVTDPSFHTYAIPEGARTALFPYFAGYTADQITANFGATPFLGAIPAGFVAWNQSQEAASGAESAYPFWNPSDKAAAITLSNGNQTFVATDSGHDGVRSIRSHRNGKYFAVFYDIAFTADSAVGLADTTRALTGEHDFADHAALLFSYGEIGINGGLTEAWGASYDLTGHFVEMAADLEKGKIWFRIDQTGDWNNSVGADPATNVGGLNLRDLGWAWDHLFVYGLANLSGDTATVLLTDTEVPSSYVIAPPAGFRWWNDEAASSEFASEQHSSAHAGSDSQEQASSSDKKAHDAASSDHLLFEQASSSDFLLHERNSSDKRIHDAESSSDHLLAEQASSSNAEAASSDKKIHDAESSSDAPGNEQASSEFQSDITDAPAPPIQVVALVSS